MLRLTTGDTHHAPHLAVEETEEKQAMVMRRAFLAAALLLTVAASAPAAGLEQASIFVSGRDAYHTYRIPSLLVTKKGTLLAFCEGRKKGASDAGDIDVLLRRSFDGGQTWARTQVVWDDVENTCGNPCPVVDVRTGTIWLLLTHNLGRDTEAMIANGTSKGTRTAWVTRSDDDGATWSKPVEITRDVKKSNWTWYATGPGVGIQLRSGRLVVPCDNQVAGSKMQQSHVIYSDDGGKTWQVGGVVGPRCDESQAVELQDGSLLLNMRSSRGDNHRLIAISKDGGETFSKPVADRQLIEPVCQASILRYPGGRGGTLFSNPASTKREKMTVRLSCDEGKTWPHARVLHNGPSAYSCLAVLPDGTIACLYERGDRSVYETIALARFSLIWLSAPGEPDSSPEQEELVFSVKTWEGDYFSKDVPAGVEGTPVVGAIYSVKGDGTGLRKVVALGKNTDYPTFSPDGRWIYFQSNTTGHSQIYRCRPDGSGVANLTKGSQLGEKWKDAFGYSLAADGTQMLYTVHDGSTGCLALAEADGSRPRLIAPELGYCYMGTLSPAKDRVVFSGPGRGCRLLVAPLPEGKAVELTPDHPDSFVPQITPDGKTIVFIRRDGDVYRVDADGKHFRRLTEGNGHVEFRLSAQDRHGSTDSPHVSPNGKRIAYVAVKDGVANVCVMNLDGSGQRQLSFRKAPCGRVRWNPKGTRVAFVSFEGRYPQLFVVSAMGGEPRQLTRLQGAVYFLDWKPARKTP
jgi:sialidase-1